MYFIIGSVKVTVPISIKSSLS